MANATARLLPEFGEGPVLIDLTFAAERVRPRGSLWAALLIATFTGLTGVGLGARTIMAPRITTGSAQVSRAPSGTSEMAPESRSGPDVPIATVATVAVARNDPRTGALTILVAGWAPSATGRVTVTVRLAGHVIAAAVIPIPGEASLPAAVDRAGVAVSPWSIRVPVPTPPPNAADDRVAVVTVARAGVPDHDDRLTVVLGDGRGGG